MTLAVFAASHLIARCADQGLANACGLATLRHGTNPLSWLSIHLTGANPHMGGSSIGGDFGNGFHAQNIGRFYMATDEGRWGQNFISRGMKTRVVPRGYAIDSTCNLLTKVYIPKIFSQIIAVYVGAYILPTIRFRFSQDEVNKMKPDRSIPGYARSVDYAISPLNIGFAGTIKNAFTLKTFSRINENRARFITGVAQLCLCAFVVQYLMMASPALFVANQVSMVAGTVLGVL